MNNKTENNDLDLRRPWHAMRRKWWLYAIAFAVFMSMAAIYAVFRMPSYESYASLLIEQSSQESSMLAAASQKSSSAMRMLNLGSATTGNEMKLITSNNVMGQVVRKAGLNFMYVGRDGLSRHLYYPNSTAPVAVEIPEAVIDTLVKGCFLKIHLHDGKADIRACKGPKGIITAASVENVTLPCDFKTPALTVRIAPTPSYRPDIDEIIDVAVTGTQAAIEDLRKNINIEETDKNIDAIDLSMKGPSKLRDETILNLLMDTYNERRLARRRENAALELEYCNDRLEKLITQLSDSEYKVEEFKRKHNTFAMALDSAGWIAKSLGSRVEASRAQNELTYYDQVLYTLQHDKNHKSFIPSSFNGERSNPLADQYNELVAQKAELERSATDDNPALSSINQQLEDMRRTLITNFSQNVELSRNNLASLYSLQGEARGEMSQTPTIERQLYDLLRDKYIKNEIYLYLLQRREAAELKLYATDTYGFVVDRAYSDSKPLMIKSIIAFLIALLLSIVFPTVYILYVMKRRDALQLPIDTSFIGLEDSTVIDTDNGPAALRAMILSRKDADTIYVADLSSENDSGIDSLADSLAAIGVTVTIVRPEDIASGTASNDIYLTRAAAERFDELHRTYDYVLAELPEPESLAGIAPAVDADNALLVVMTQPGRTRRTHLRRILRGQMAEHVLVYIRTKIK